MIRSILFLLIIYCCCGCRSTKSLTSTTVDSVSTSAINDEVERHTSIDSVIIEHWHEKVVNNDTVFVNNRQEVHHFREVTHLDTVYIVRDTTTVQDHSTAVSKTRKSPFFLGMGILAVIIISIFLTLLFILFVLRRK